MDNHSQRSAFFYALSAVLIWSTVATAFKIALQDNSVLILVTGASVTSLIVLGFILTFQGNLSRALTSFPKTLGTTALLGTINPISYYLILFEAYDRLPAQVAQPINYTWAIMLALLAVPLLGHRLGKNDLIALLLGYCGVTLISFAGKKISGSLDGTGLTLALLSTVLWALYWILNTRQKQDPTISLFHNFLFASPILICLALLWPHSTMTVTVKSLSSIIYIGLFEMGITFFLWQQAMHRTNNAAKLGTLIFLSPIISLWLINLILKEPLQWQTFMGLVLIIGGIWLSQNQSSSSLEAD